MTEAAIFSAFWLGILTAVSPCPLATNIAAISFIGRKAGEKEHVLGSGFLYALGRTLAYVALGSIITAGIMGSSAVSRFLQQYMNEALGPIMIVLGLILLGWIGSGVSISFGAAALQEKAGRGGMIWALPVGVIFALSFCPVSAGLFFGGLLPLALQQQSVLVLPVIYGIGTALPVVIFAFIMAFASAYVGRAFNRLTQIERWVRYLTGTAFILAGIYYCLIHIYGVVF